MPIDSSVSNGNHIWPELWSGYICRPATPLPTCSCLGLPVLLLVYLEISFAAASWESDCDLCLCCCQGRTWEIRNQTVRFPYYCYMSRPVYTSLAIYSWLLVPGTKRSIWLPPQGLDLRQTKERADITVTGFGCLQVFFAGFAGISAKTSLGFCSLGCIIWRAEQGGMVYYYF